MNKRSIDRLVNQYLTSINTTDSASTTAASTVPVTSNIGSLTANTFYYPYGSTISTNGISATT